MKRKVPARESAIAPEIIESARQILAMERPELRAAKCVVCGESTAAERNSAEAGERLCWVCRRLKISAWRDTDHQLPAQE